MCMCRDRGACVEGLGHSMLRCVAPEHDETRGDEDCTEEQAHHLRCVLRCVLRGVVRGEVRRVVRDAVTGGKGCGEGCGEDRCDGVY